MKRLTLIAVLTFTVTSHAPEGCTIIGAWEDDSQVATCQDGSRIALDPDGREAGPWGPAHEAGAWYEVEQS